MDKGIRPASIAKFAELLPTRAEVGNTAFRKNVMFYLMDQYGCTNPAAATHYNHAFQQAKQNNPALVGPVAGGAAGTVAALGRAEGKNNGGRKKKEVVPVLPEAAAADVGPRPFPKSPEEVPEAAVTETPTAEVAVALVEEAAQTVLYTVKKKCDDSVVAEGLTKEDADAMIAKAKSAKKAALYC